MNESTPITNLKDLLAEELAREVAAPSAGPEMPPLSATTDPYWVEHPVPFAESRIWEWQREFFHTAGPEAWRQGVVPHYITSSSYVGYAYAQVVLAHQEDRARLGETSPLTVMELGGGSGQFTFHFLRHYAALALPHLPPLRYVFTDVVQANLDFVREHPRMAEWIALGTLDVALFDVLQPEPLALQVSEGSLLSVPTGQPLWVMANYVWDTIPMELWRFREGNAYPLHVGLQLAEAPEEEPNYQMLPELTLAFEEQPQPEGLSATASRYLADGVQGEVLIPEAALACLDWLADRTQGNLLLLSGDKPLAGPFASENAIRLVHHGSFSLQVNFEAIQAWAKTQNGYAFMANRWHTSMHVSLLAAGGVAVGDALTQGYQQWLSDFHPGDQFALKRTIEENYPQLSPQEVLAYVRFSRYDPKALRRGLPTLMEYVNGFSPPFQQELLALIDHTWDNYYPMGEEPDLAFLIASLLYEADLFAPALRYFEYSALLYGPDEGTVANIRSCQEMLAEPDED